MDPLNILAKFEIRSFSHSLDNRGYPKNLGSPWIRPRFLFSKTVHGLLIGWTLLLLWPNLKFVALPIPEIITMEFWVGCKPQSWGRGGRRGSGMVPFERALVSSYRSSIVTFRLSLRVSEIGLLPLLCSSTPLFPTPPIVSPKFPHVPLVVSGWHLGYEERRYWANCSCS